MVAPSFWSGICKNDKHQKKDIWLSSTAKALQVWWNLTGYSPSICIRRFQAYTVLLLSSHRRSKKCKNCNEEKTFSLYMFTCVLNKYILHFPQLLAIIITRWCNRFYELFIFFFFMFSLEGDPLSPKIFILLQQ